MMRRREFITLLGGAAAAWPLAARAQQPEQMRRIGVLIAQAAEDPESQANVTAFAQGMQESGWIVGRNVQVEYRWGAGDADRVRQFATELAALAPDVIVTSGASTMPPLLRATRSPFRLSSSNSEDRSLSISLRGFSDFSNRIVMMTAGRLPDGG